MGLRLVELLQVLADTMDIEVEVDTIERVVGGIAESGPWRTQIEHGTAAIGLRVRWMVAPVFDAVKLARPDLPVLGRSASGEYWLLDKRALNFVHAGPVAESRPARWMSRKGLAERMGPGPHTWALVEPVLPTAPLSCSDGKRTPLQRLQSLLYVERRDVLVVMMYGAVAGLLSLATPLAIQVLINWLAFGALLQPIVILGAALAVCLSLAAALQLLQRVGVEAIERRVFVRAVADLSARLARVRVSAFDGLSGPELANRFFDVLTVQKAAGTLLLDGFTAALQVLVAVTLLGVYHPWLLVFDLLLLAGMAFVLFPLGRGAQRTAINESNAKYAVAAWIEEVARHPIALRQDSSVLAESRADTLARSWLFTRRSHFRVFLRQFAGVQALQVLMSAVLLVASGALVLQGQLTIGQLVAAEFIVTTALLGFAKFADKLDTVYDLLAGVDKLGTLLDLPPERPSGLSRIDSGPAEVELTEASNYYHHYAGVGPITWTFPAGSRTVVRGAAGSGKTALGDLVSGVRTPTAGTVRRDGVALTALTPPSRYHGVIRLGVNDLLMSSIRDNVALGRTGITDARVLEALEAVGLGPRVEALPDGVETVLSPLGSPLSKNEQRALLVARAVASNPRLMVVDDVLDGLDPETRERLMSALCKSGCPWTLVLLTSDPHVTWPGATHLSLHAGALGEATSSAAS